MPRISFQENEQEDGGFKMRKLIFAVLAVSLIWSASAVAEDAYSKVKVFVEGKEVKDAGIIRDGSKSPLVSLNALDDELQAFVSYDADKQVVSVSKPNVHVFPIQVSKDGQVLPFGSVTEGANQFKIQAQVDSLQVKIDGLKFTLQDPKGKVVYSTTYDEDQVKELGKEFWLTSPTIKHDFKFVGKYTVRVWMTQLDTKDWTLVSEKVIRSQAE
jgi:hypothetical protein